jgi:DNA polymerase-1
LTRFYVQYGFKSLAAKSGEPTVEKKSNVATAPHPGLFDEPEPAVQPVGEVVYETVLDVSHLMRWVERISAAELTCIDTETQSLNSLQARLVGISLATEPRVVQRNWMWTWCCRTFGLGLKTPRL